MDTRNEDAELQQKLPSREADEQTSGTPDPSPDWQTEERDRVHQLDAEWQSLQQIEMAHRRRLQEEDLDPDEHDALFAKLGAIWQRLTEIEQEIEHGPDWALDGHGNDEDK